MHFKIKSKKVNIQMQFRVEFKKNFGISKTLKISYVQCAIIRGMIWNIHKCDMMWCQYLGTNLAGQEKLPRYYINVNSLEEIETIKNNIFMYKFSNDYLNGSINIDSVQILKSTQFLFKALMATRFFWRLFTSLRAVTRSKAHITT